MKAGLYTVTYSGVWYRGPVLSPVECIAKAKELGFSGVEIGLKRPQASPLDLDMKARDDIKEALAKQGIDLAACASYNDFSSPVLEQREVELYFLRGQIDVTRDLGTSILRVFAAWPGITLRDGLATYEMTRRHVQNSFPDTTTLEKWNFVKEGLQEAAKYAVDQGVVLALQNHGPVIMNYRDMLDIIREVDSPGLKACLDCPLLRDSHDADVVTRAVRETGELQVNSHYGWEAYRDEKGAAQLRTKANYAAFIRALKGIGYDGYLCYEFCHLCLDEKHEVCGMETIDEHAVLAAEYMNRVIEENT